MFHSRMKPKCFLFLVLLGSSQLISLTVSFINESIVENYVVERKFGNSDVFFVNTKNGTKCRNGQLLYRWCMALEAYAYRHPCGCECNIHFPSFITSFGRCVKGDQLPTNFEGCPKNTYSNLFGIKNNPVFKHPVDLGSKIERTTSVNYKAYNCSLSGYYFDYSGFEVRWKSITDGIFILKKRGQKYFIQKEGQHKSLSGRIIKLNLTCISITQPKQPRKESCYLFKAVGTVMYYALNSTSLVNVFPTTVIRSSPTPIFLFSPSSHRHSYQVTKTGIPTSSVNTWEPNYSEPSELPTMESSLPTGHGTGDKEDKAREKNKVAIGAGVGGPLAIGVIVVGVIIVFCKRRKSRKNTQKETKPAVIIRNLGVDIDDEIQMESPMEPVPTFSEKDSQSTYQGLVNNSGKSNGEAMRNTSEDNSGYCHLYQCVNKNTPVTGAPVYQNVSAPVTVPDYQNVQKPVAAPNYQNVQTLKGGTPHGSVHTLGSQTESAYEPREGSGRQNSYENLNKS